MMNHIFKNPVLFISAIIILAAASLSNAAENKYTANVHELPLLEAPYNAADGVRYPGMNQSMNITKDYYEGIHGIFSLAHDDFPYLSLIASGCTDVFLLSTMPVGSAWVHEEFHRAVMGQYGIDSYNDVYNFDITAETIAVSHVKDADLQNLKDRHPADMVRLSSAGIEGEYEWIRTSSEDFFFSKRNNRYERFNWFLSTLNSSLYIYACTTADIDTETDKMNAVESDIKRRDFTGMDFTAWVYDLFRPDEPYAARGVHPLGNGFDRYIKRSDLTSAERKFLKRQYYLSLMNFAAPQMFGLQSIDINASDGSPSRWMFFFMHFLTSSGSSSELHVLSEWNDYNLAGVLRVYQSRSLYLPGAEVTLKRFALDAVPLVFDASAAMWLQPKDQMFHQKHFRPGASASLKAAYQLSDLFELYITLKAKTKGWQAGEVSLGNAAGVLIGVQCVL